MTDCIQMLEGGKAARENAGELWTDTADKQKHQKQLCQKQCEWLLGLTLLVYIQVNAYIEV